MRPTLHLLKQRALALWRRTAAATRRWLDRLLARWRHAAAPPSPQPTSPGAQAPGAGEEPQPLQPDARADGRPAAHEGAPQPMRPAAPGEFASGYFKHREGDRRYRLFVPPPAADGSLRPLLVMLHGCKQHADDFAAGTQMNELALEHGLYVLYPEQPRSANMLRCWNWFKRRHQQRDSGEPALLADLTRATLHEHDIDATRVYVAGLSAGGAMAAILGHTYPDLFAAVGVHSGVPRGAAHDVASALAAMKDAGASDHPWAHESFRRRSRTADALVPLVPTIVFHGDLDTTVHPRNAELVLEAALGSARGDEGAGQPLTSTEAGRSTHGLPFTRTVHRDAGSGLALAEHWVVHGVGHAWSGGNASGSYTDARGPDASREMLRFFAGHVLPQRDATRAVEVLA
jgi:poly(hydroxyalkanoate) depolymerase family esterase